MQLQVGPVKIGSEHPIALQTMTTTDTRNIQATVDQVGVECLLPRQPLLGLKYGCMQGP